MREILFRGQHRRKGEKVQLDGTPVDSKWVYGGYCQYNEERGIIYQVSPEIEKYSVYADTVGQYTGLTDRNGIKVFEGDIVKTSKFGKISDYIIVGGFDTFAVVYKPCRFRLVNKKRGFDFVNIGGEQLEVIGNIYDTPELLKKGRMKK